MTVRLVICLLRLIALLPLSVLYVASDIGYVLCRHVLRYRRTLVRRQLQAAFPGRTTQELRQIERRFYHHLCDVGVETVKLLHISDKELRQRIQVENTDVVDTLAAEGRNMILLLGHFGNWEWVQEILYRFRTLHVGGEIYKPLRNPTMDAVMLRIRRRFSRNLLIPQNEAVRTILRLRQEGQTFMIGFICDQRPSRHQLKQWTNFLGLPTPFISGAEHIGQRIGAEFIFLDVKKPRRGHYVFSFRKIPSSFVEANSAPELREYPATRIFLNMLEKDILQQPHLWLWTHNRWKHQQRGVEANIKH